MKRIALLLGLLAGAGFSKELLTFKHIAHHLRETNPYVYSAVGQKYIAKARSDYALGAFDTLLQARYDKKEYPTSDGELTDVTLTKPIENGMEFLLGYREAQGVQEYSNIKTGDEGEMRLGLKVPLLPVLNNLGTRKFNLQNAAIGAQRSNAEAEENLRHLYFKIASDYYALLYRRELLALESDLLAKARKRRTFIEKKVQVGALPELALLEARQQIINRRQRLFLAENGLNNALEAFAAYLNLSKETLQARYELPRLPGPAPITVDRQEALNMAFEKRPDLQMLRLDTDRYELQSRYNALSRFPAFDVALYGVHDFKYDSGFKVTLNVAFPVERRRYHAKAAEIQKGLRQIGEENDKRLLEIRSAVHGRFNTLAMLQQTIGTVHEELELVQALEVAEAKKYRHGLSDLFTLNQREIYTLQIRQKKLGYYLQFWQTAEAIAKETGSPTLLKARM